MDSGLLEKILARQDVLEKKINKILQLCESKTTNNPSNVDDKTCSKFITVSISKCHRFIPWHIYNSIYQFIDEFICLGKWG